MLSIDLRVYILKTYNLRQVKILSYKKQVVY